MSDEEKNYRMTRMDYLIIKLMKVGDDEFVAEVLDSNGVLDYDPLPIEVSDKIADILEERLIDLTPGETTPEDIEA